MNAFAPRVLCTDLESERSISRLYSKPGFVRPLWTSRERIFEETDHRVDEVDTEAAVAGVVDKAGGVATVFRGWTLKTPMLFHHCHRGDGYAAFFFLFVCPDG